MDLRADTGDRVPPLAQSVSIPTAGQVVIRSLPAAAVGLLGLPLLGRFLPPGVGEGWWFLSALAIMTSTFLVLYLVQAPRPRVDKQVSQERWSWSLAYVAKHRSVSTDPGVRTAAALAACSEIELFIVHVGIVVGGVLGNVIRPGFFWLSFVGASTGAGLVAAFRLRRSCFYLRLVHAMTTTE
ncbi:hypothetical protein [Kocuria aegyptia]|uniref:MFS transporter n=1 Tax=Kocuria aegyptia TaxID=330943 RepID=A0ABN2K8J6_9MICC